MSSMAAARLALLSRQASKEWDIVGEPVLNGPVMDAPASGTSTPTIKTDLKRFRANLRDELHGAAVYDALAAAEHDPIRKDVYRQLAEAEREHADHWRTKLR